MANLGGLVVTMGANLGPLRRKLALAKGQLQEFRAVAHSTGQSLMNMGTKLSMAFTVPIAGAVGFATKAYSSLEKELIGVQKTTDATYNTVRKLGSGLMELSEQTGVARQSITKTAEMAGQLGIATENIEEFTEVMTMMDVATDVTSEQAAIAFARIANITGLATDKIENLASVVVELGNNTATFESRILTAGLRMASAANNAGFLQEDLMALAASITSVRDRIRGGATAVSTMIKAMNASIIAGDERLTAFAETAGMTAEQFETAFREDAASALIEFLEGLKQMAEEGKNTEAVLDAVQLNQRQTSLAIMSLASSVEKVAENFGMARKEFKANIALQEEATKFFNSLEQQLKGLWNQIKNTTALLGEAFRKELQTAIKAIGNFLERIQKFIRALNDLDKPTRNMILRIAGFAAAIGPVIMVVGGLITVVTALLTPLSAAIGALITWGGVMVATSDSGEVLSKTIDILKSIFYTIEPIINGAVNAFINISNYISKLAQKYMPMIKNAWEEISPVLSRGIKNFIKILKKQFVIGVLVIKRLIKGFTIMAKVLKPIFETVVKIISNNLKRVWKAINALLDTFINLLQGNWTAAWQSFKTVVASAVSGIIEILKYLAVGMIDILTKLTGTVSEAWATFWNNLIGKGNDYAKIAVETMQLQNKWNKGLEEEKKNLMDSANALQSKLDSIESVNNETESVIGTTSNYLKKLGAFTKGNYDLSESLKEIRGLLQGFNKDAQNLNKEISNIIQNLGPLLERFSIIEFQPLELPQMDFSTPELELKGMDKWLNDKAEQFNTYRKEQEWLNKIRKNREDYSKEFLEWIGIIKDKSNELGNTIQNIARNFESAFTGAIQEMVDTSKNGFVLIRDAFVNTLEQMVAAFASRAAIFGILNIISGGTIGGTAIAKVLGSETAAGYIFGGGRADGGPVSSNKSYWVGEKQPELFTPNTNGMVETQQDIVGTLEKGFSAMIDSMPESFRAEFDWNNFIEFYEEKKRRRDNRRKGVWNK